MLNYVIRATNLKDDCQVIVRENVDPPSFLFNKKRGVTFFSGNNEIGREGFF